jgi:hypothetical protein
MRALEAARATRRIDRSRRELNAALGEEQAFALVGTGRSLWTTTGRLDDRA